MREHGDEVFRRHVGDEVHVGRQRRVDLPQVAEAIRHLAGARIGVGPEPDRRHVERRHGPQRGLEVLAVVALGRHRVLHHHQVGPAHVDRRADAVAIDALAGDVGVHVGRQLDVERAGVEHVARILAHQAHPPLGVRIGHEMQVRQLGDRMAHALVDAAGDVAALDVRDRDVQVGRGHRDGELFEAIAADHHHVGLQRMQAVGELERRQARGLGHRHVVAALDDVEQRRRDVEALGFDVVGDVAAVLVEQDRSAEHQLQIQIRMRVQLLDQQLAAAVVGPIGDREADLVACARQFASMESDGPCADLARDCG